jgi:hypothetical protein
VSAHVPTIATSSNVAVTPALLAADTEEMCVHAAARPLSAGPGEVLFTTRARVETP